jgi:DNA polymerase
MSVCRLDLETRSDVDINLGVYRYVESPHFKILIACYRIDDGPLQTWTYAQPPPADLLNHISTGGEISAFNAAFERLCLENHARRHGWPMPRLEQFRCTAVTAAAMGLPRSLDRAAVALGTTAQKDKRGKALIKKFSIPSGPGPVWNEPEDHPEDFAAFADYCKKDVEAEEEIARRLIPLSDSEMRVYHLNERINDRGIRIDIASARAALRLADRAKHQIDLDIAKLTNNQVPTITAIGRLKEWMASRGVPVSSLGKDDIDDLEHLTDLPVDVRQALELRREGGKTSVSKIQTMLNVANADGRARGLYLHHGAGQTGRFSSKSIQVHNLTKYRKIFEDAKVRQSELFDAIRTGDPDVLRLQYGDELGRPMALLSDSIRGFLWADEGCELIDADYSSIEGRIAAWYGHEEWKLEAFRALDRGEGHGIYELAAAGIYCIPVEEITNDKRPVGKVAELALGFAGSVGALSRMARANKMNLASVFAPLWEAADHERRESARKRYEERLKAHDELAQTLGHDAWFSAELIKIGWRARHPGICGNWKAVERAAYAAVESAGSVIEPDGIPAIRYLVRHGYLWCRLPSGRCLAYANPQIRDVEVPWADKTLEPAKREKQSAVTVRGIGANNQWIRYPLNRSILYNHLVQSSARDILVHGMLNAEAAGFPIVLHTHDEAAAEVPRGSRTVKEFEDIMSVLPEWASGLPITASGWAGKRYRKD